MAIKFEKKLEESEERSIGKECWEQIKKKENKTELEETRRKFFEKRGWSRQEVERRLEEGEEIWGEMTQRGIDIERQENRIKIEESRFAKEVKKIINTGEIPEYIGNNRKNKKGEMEITGRFRLEGENRSSRYWMKEDDKLCSIC